MNNNTYVIVMAGGIGSRFWPLSTPEKPKQFLDILHCGQTMLQQTVSRISSICPDENILIVTSEHYRSIVQEQLPQLSHSQILFEPCMRNTAPCIAYACWKINKINPEAQLIVLPSDQYVGNTDAFLSSIKTSLAYLKDHNTVVTLGIPPTEPATGYGYIQAATKKQLKENEIVPVADFKEKPDRPTAINYLLSGNYFWNAGIFIGKGSTFREAFHTYLPVMAEQFNSITAALYTEKEQQAVNELYPQCENISVDYGILEKLSAIAIVKTAFEWSDLGAWNALHQREDKDEQNNSEGHAKLVHTKNCLLHLPPEVDALIQGVEDLIIVFHNNKLLISHKNMEQQIKENSKKN